ncbi:ferredoxin--NADP+ reductase [Plasticicumulans lactativorans]|uniref:ferredoxin--NADP(+) reductase n=1 Tax=Plasticicumulans lactativorans TaxID=1133106 RepID=A0A4R2L4P2_9GAMM|nr:ferredoxin--NADP reductase [Plasticicumulans lactativorans]TCO78939.1 ferredoxin--NADP+ reductase [Plasticicumulans lactativorans]
MSAAEKYTVEKITEIQRWAPNLFSFKTTRHPGYRFVPGQFARLGVRKDDAIVWRAYSIASANWEDHLEFYSIVVPNGEFTTELAKLQEGDELFVEKTNYGFLTTDRFECGRDLWMLSTGTGLAPFISILYDFDTWEQYERIVLVHSVREAHELTYQEEIRSFGWNELFAEHAHKLEYVQVVTREAVDGALGARITELLASGELEAHVGLPISVEHSRVMICGNPDMVEETRKLLTTRGLTVAKRGKPGNLAVENYW